jgi:DNA primase
MALSFLNIRGQNSSGSQNEYGLPLLLLPDDAMPGVDFQAVRSMVSMQEVLELLGFVPTATRGQQVYGDCPVRHCCNRRRRSFSANRTKNNYRCFLCGSHGNQLDLWAAATNQSLFDAAVDLCKRMNIDVPWIHHW